MLTRIYQSLYFIYEYFYPNPAIIISNFDEAVYKKRDYDHGHQLVLKLLNFAKDHPSFKDQIMRTLNQALIILASLPAHKNQVDFYNSLLNIPDIDIDYRSSPDFTTPFHSPFFYAVENNHIKIVNLLLDREKRDIDIDFLIMAIKNENIGIVKLLLQKNINLNIANKYGDLALITAIENSCYSEEKKEILKMLLERPNIEVDITDKARRTPLMLMLNNYDVNKDPCLRQYHNIQLLLEKKNISVNNTKYKSRTPLMIAAQAGMTKVIALLLKNENININATDEEGRTALMLAAMEGRTDVIELLLKNENINLNAVANDGNTALTISILSDHFTALSLLRLDSKINVNLLDKDGKTPLYLAFSVHNHEAAQALLKFPEIDVHLLPEPESKYYKNYLNLGLNCGNFKFLVLLSYSHSNIFSDFLNTIPYYYQHPLISATKNQFSSAWCGMELLKRIIALSADINSIVDKDNNNTPLIWAAINGDTGAIQLLLEAGANPEIRNKEDKTALMLVKNEKSRQLIEDFIQSKKAKDSITAAQELIRINSQTFFLQVKDHYSKAAGNDVLTLKPKNFT